MIPLKGDKSISPGQRPGANGFIPFALPFGQRPLVQGKHANCVAYTIQTTLYS